MPCGVFPREETNHEGLDIQLLLLRDISLCTPQSRLTGDMTLEQTSQDKKNRPGGSPMARR